jgi:hypothetical protein
MMWNRKWRKRLVMPAAERRSMSAKNDSSRAGRNAAKFLPVHGRSNIAAEALEFEV